MSNLSPAAQAVVESVAQQLLNPYGTIPLPAMAAAALREAASRNRDLIPDLGSAKYAKGIEASSAFLESIAAELENAS